MTAPNDREVLELAAKANAMVGAVWNEGLLGMVTTHDSDPWNPLTDDGDALRLAVKLHISMEFWNTDNFVRANVVIGGKHCSPSERYANSAAAAAATRRAIVRAAAEIGKVMP